MFKSSGLPDDRHAARPQNRQEPTDVIANITSSDMFRNMVFSFRLGEAMLRLFRQLVK
jgi:hypothetical protein